MNGAVVHPQQVFTRVVHEAVVDQPVDAKHRNCRAETRPRGEVLPDDPRVGRKPSSSRRLKKQQG